MPFKTLSRRTFLTASSALAFLHTPFARALPARHLNKPSAKGKRSSCLLDSFVTISTPTSSFLQVKRYTSLEACEATAEGDLSYRTAAR